MPLVSYGDDSSDEDDSNNQVHQHTLPQMNAAPIVSLSTGTRQLVPVADVTTVATKTAVDQDLIYHPNSLYDENQTVRPTKRRNILTGYAVEQAFDDATFKIQHQTFQTLGYAYDPSIDEGILKRDNGLVGNLDNAKANLGQDISQIRPSKTVQKTIKSKRASKGDASILDGKDAYQGPWAKYKGEDSESSSSYEDEEAEEVQNEEEQEQTVAVDNTIKETLKSPEINETTQFHGKNERDYLGRTYMHIPQDLDINLIKEPGEQEWFIPKRKIHSWRGHSGGVTGLRFFPKSGHLLLSAGNDSKVRIWDVYHERQLLRTYSGHTKAVKDIDFNPDGRQFLTCSYDKMIKLWDTETGTCISRFNSKNSTGGRIATPNCIRFNPRPEHEGHFLAAMDNKKIIQFDLRTPDEIIQEYDHHLGAVNTITFVDDNHRFMTTSDDKSIRVWDWGVNVPIKFIADPQQHSMPSVKLHPGGKYVAAQSMDNRILVFGATDRFRPNRKKEFSGYNCAGYAIEISFSPDGRYIISGDSEGYVFFWDWKTCSIRSKIKAHDSLVSCVAVHPQETSKVATGGLDAKIHYWD